MKTNIKKILFVIPLALMLFLLNGCSKNSDPIATLTPTPIITPLATPLLQSETVSGGTFQFSYDANNKVTSYTDGTKTYTVTRNAQALISKVSQASLSTTYNYDANVKMIQSIYLNTGNNIPDTTNYKYFSDRFETYHAIGANQNKEIYYYSTDGTNISGYERYYNDVKLLSYAYVYGTAKNPETITGFTGSYINTDGFITLKDFPSLVFVPVNAPTTIVTTNYKSDGTAYPFISSSVTNTSNANGYVASSIEVQGNLQSGSHTYGYK